MVTTVAKHLARGWETSQEVGMLWAVVDNTARHVGAPVLEPGVRPGGLRPMVEEMERLRAGGALVGPSAVELA